MNNKEFITALAEQIGSTEKDTSLFVEAFGAELADILDEGGVVTIQGFGNFEVKKKMERILSNPITKQRMLVPPKLVLNFKASPALKDKVNRNTNV